MRILVTGGSGFLGRGLARALGKEHEVVLAARNHEANAAAERETGCRSIPLDVCRPESVRDVLASERPVVVVHAAASKRVQAAESHPLECVDVNIRGSQNVARAAAEYGVEVVLAISTDKAAGATAGLYGATKAVMERMLCALDSGSKTAFACVRLGNVAWSTGSVLPEWQRMLREDGVISTTGPDMRRFLISLDEAIAIVRSALERIDELRGGVVVPAMRAARIGDLLEEFAEEHGCRWTTAPRRPGDADDEVLLAEGELPFARSIDLGWLVRFSGERGTNLIAQVTSATAPRLTRPELRSLVRGDGSSPAAPG